MPSRVVLNLAILALFGGSAVGQNYPYVLATAAGSYPLGDGGPAAQALLLNPTAVAQDGSGNMYIADANDYRIRKIAANGTISTVTQVGVYVNDMKLGKDGNLYLSANGVIGKVTPAGSVSVVAGNGTIGSSGDGGPAVSALVGATGGIALDSSSNIYFVDGHRIREISASTGNIQTIAGGLTAGPGPDNVAALSTTFNTPAGIAFDSANNLYIADTYNYRVRKLTASSGIVTSIAGTGTEGPPTNGNATSSGLGPLHGLTVDSSGNVIVTDIGYLVIFQVSPSGTLTTLAGQSAVFGYSDGPAATTYLFNPFGVIPDGSGGIYYAEYSSNRIRHISGGSVSTTAGKLHYAGDGGAATAALIYNAVDEVVDAQGNFYINDSGNFRVRKVSPSGAISTFAGNGLAGTAVVENSQATSGALPQVYSIAIDGQGSVYLGVYQKIYKITQAGIISTFAGSTSASSGSGDGGPASSAGFGVVTGLVVDGSGNVYVGDSVVPRIRIITTDGKINNYAGSSGSGYSGDGGLATSAKLSGFGPLAVDSKGNLYIGDTNNHVVRMVTPGGIISTIIGNGTAGSPADGGSAKTSQFYGAAGLVADAGGNVYVTCADYSTYKLDTAGIIHVIAGTGKTAVADGLIATATSGFLGKGIRVLNSTGDLLVADPLNSVIRQMTLDSPSGIVAAGGNSQSGPTGSALPNPIRVTVNGRAGVPVPGVTVNFTVASGQATLSAGSSVTDATGTAGIAVTLGSSAGTVTITASIAGTALPAATFTETATSINPNCTIGTPAITSVRSLTDFGGLSSFGSGSWLEIKGSNLAIDARLWAGNDFNGSNAPTMLDGSGVSINGNAGFVEYISPGQINVQAPADSATGAAPITVSNCAGTSNPVSLQKAAIAPGVLATSAFNIGGKQYLVALYQDGVTFVGNVGLIAGVPFRPAKPGDVITIYGIGFGAVTPAQTPGVVVAQQNAIAGLTVSFGQTAATTGYAGLAPGNIGLYQINITVPNVPAGDYQINIGVGGVGIQQTVYLTVSQ